MIDCLRKTRAAGRIDVRGMVHHAAICLLNCGEDFRNLTVDGGEGRAGAGWGGHDAISRASGSKYV